MNHHWLEKWKLRVNRARFREAGHQRESPSKYVMHKMELLMPVYSYSDTEMIQAIMMEVPGTWASIINPQYQKTLREFQNAVKYHEESVEKQRHLSSNHLTFLIGNTLTRACPTKRLTSTFSGGPKILKPLCFLRMIITCLLQKPLTS